MLDASTPLQYPGIPMSRFGLAPDGKPKYRLIWAPSRMVTLTGRGKTMTVPMYTGPTAIEPVGDYWIIEEWKSAADYYRGTEEDWNADPRMLNLGPYPRHGTYVRRETLSCNPCEANIEKLITWFEEGRNRRPSENAVACRENMEASMRDKKNKRDAIIKGSMRPFMGDYSAAGGGRSLKSYNVSLSAQEAGLPTRGTTTARPSGVVYEVPQEEI